MLIKWYNWIKWIILIITIQNQNLYNFQNPSENKQNIDNNVNLNSLNQNYNLDPKNQKLPGMGNYMNQIHQNLYNSNPQNYYNNFLTDNNKICILILEYSLDLISSNSICSFFLLLIILFSIFVLFFGEECIAYLYILD